MRWALVFSGQGLQHPDMLSWLAHSPLLAAMTAELGPDWRERLADPLQAGHNGRAQLLLTATACAAWAQLQPLLPAPPSIVLGYSVGELAAFAAAGALSAPDALKLSILRAQCMDQAAELEPTGLLGLTGAAAGDIERLCRGHDLEVAIRIDAGAAVVGGLRSNLLAAAEDASRRHVRCTPLNIAMASHTRWMRAAAEAFAQHLVHVTAQAPALTLFSHAMGRVRTPEEARGALWRQLFQTVPWDASMDAIAAEGVQAVLEIGPGQALARMWRERHPDIPARSVDEFRHPAAIATWLSRHLTD